MSPRRSAMGPTRTLCVVLPEPGYRYLCVRSLEVAQRIAGPKHRRVAVLKRLNIKLLANPVEPRLVHGMEPRAGDHVWT